MQNAPNSRTERQGIAVSGWLEPGAYAKT